PIQTGQAPRSRRCPSAQRSAQPVSSDRFAELEPARPTLASSQSWKFPISPPPIPLHHVEAPSPLANPPPAPRKSLPLRLCCNVLTTCNITQPLQHELPLKANQKQSNLHCELAIKKR